MRGVSRFALRFARACAWAVARAHAVLAALCGLVVVNATALALHLFVFERHTTDHQDARHISHLAHGALLLLNAAALMSFG